jgi:hypothetical protein
MLRIRDYFKNASFWKETMPMRLIILTSFLMLGIYQPVYAQGVSAPVVVNKSGVQQSQNASLLGQGAGVVGKETFTYHQSGIGWTKDGTQISIPGYVSQEAKAEQERINRQQNNQSNITIQSLVCPKCGTVYHDKNMRFCTKDGQQLKEQLVKASTMEAVSLSTNVRNAGLYITTKTRNIVRKMEHY